MIAQREILNFNKFQSDFQKRYPKFQRNITLISPLVKESKVEIESPNINDVKTAILKIASNFPHRKCVLVYKINESSNLTIKIYPVTDAA